MAQTEIKGKTIYYADGYAGPGLELLSKMSDDEFKNVLNEAGEDSRIPDEYNGVYYTLIKAGSALVLIKRA